ncbi:MAG: Ig-like domain-containing protein, partial [Planctomycetota bacterium]
MSSAPREKRRGFVSALATYARRWSGRLPARGNRSRRRLRLEGLEDRKLLSVTPNGLYYPDLEGAAAVASSAADVNAPPMAVDDAFSMAANQQLGAGVLANDSDPEGGPLTVTLESDVTQGTLVLGTDGLFTYKPNEGFHGTDSFTYRANDGVADSSLATVSISVAPLNAAPKAENDGYLTGQDVPLIVAPDDGVLANDVDADGDALTATLVDGPSHGTLTLLADGSFEYTPDAGFRGEDVITYRASDGYSESNLAAVSLTVGPENEAPSAADDVYGTNEDETLAVDAAAGVLANDADVDGDPLAAVLVDGPANGTLTLTDDGSFQYTPNADFHGADGFSYLASDAVAESTLATVSITVEPVNDAPSAADDVYGTNEDETLVVDVAAGALANDADVDGDPLAAVLVDGPANGMLTLTDDGSFQYAPNANFHGADGFSYLASDGVAESTLATVSITVEPVNDAPAASDDVYGTNEDETLVVDAAAGP